MAEDATAGDSGGAPTPTPDPVGAGPMERRVEPLDQRLQERLEAQLDELIVDSREQAATLRVALLAAVTALDG